MHSPQPQAADGTAGAGRKMKLQNLQALRAIAAIGVVVFHAQGMAPKYTGGESLSGQIMDQLGGHGVDLFFVISGFIMRYAQPAEGYEPWRFLRARLERVVPLYWMLTVVMLVIWFSRPALFGAAPPQWASALRSLLFLSFSAGELPVIYVGWSLEYEMFFYLALLIGIYSRRDPWRAVMTVFPLLVIAGRLAGVSEWSGTALWIGRFLTDSLLLEFTLGVWLAGVLMTARVERLPSVLLAAGLLAVFVSTPSDRSLTVGLPAALLLWAAVLAENSLSITLGNWLSRLGDASYSIYLVQVFTLSAAAKLLAPILSGLPDLFVICVAGTTAMAGTLCHQILERPIVQKCKRPQISVPRSV